MGRCDEYGEKKRKQQQQHHRRQNLSAQTGVTRHTTREGGDVTSTSHNKKSLVKKADHFIRVLKTGSKKKGTRRERERESSSCRTLLHKKGRIYSNSEVKLFVCL